MDETSSVAAFAALGHPLRLRAFRLLMGAGPVGLPAGEISGCLDVPRSTLSAHLAQLERANLIRPRRERQQIFYAVDHDGTRELVDFLVEDCCEGRPELCGLRETRPMDRDPRPATVTLLAPRRGRSPPTRHGDAPVSEKRFNVLFLCRANSARSIYAECLLKRLGAGRFVAYSAGSRPAGRIDPYAVEVLHRNNYPTDGLRSKDWNEFARPDAPRMDFVFTVCDDTAGEVCPVWPGQPITAHWGIIDPAMVEGAEWERRRAFTLAFAELQNRIGIFVNLPIASLDRLKLQERLDEIGRIRLADAPSPVTESPR